MRTLLRNSIFLECKHYLKCSHHKLFCLVSPNATKYAWLNIVLKSENTAKDNLDVLVRINMWVWAFSWGVQQSVAGQGNKSQINPGCDEGLRYGGLQ